ncbi:lymphatic vessel endothelial hyaluronic receptor 1b [Danio aesculapii]|uniref:lymphatic vessel endothelial hyaluronic receptor 1b n=1 Tax=Danio aesculapii TaxID=1142201 RepID=UPI0024BF5BB0|nr:lymphatic vessel endothelial hyaluronic receptor 1b [Danio aesculapii]
MATVCLALCALFFFSSSTLCLDVSEIQVPINDGISGVFLIQTKTNTYSFDAITAKEACEAIKMTIAKKTEVETANKNGFQTCRFGWVEEQIAVIPRVEKNENCGKNNVGVITWRAELSKKFDVYCFKPADPDGSLETTSSRTQTTTGGRTPSNNHYSTKTTHPSSIKSSTSPVSTSRSFSPYTSTQSTSLSFDTSSTTFITISLSNIIDSSQTTTSPPSLSSTSSPPKFSTSFLSSSSHSTTQFLLQQSSASTDDHPAQLQTTSPNRTSLRAAPKTFVIISVVLLLLLAAAGAAWYLKIKRGQRFPSWTRMRPKQIIETEMFKQISERHCISEQTNKENNNWTCNNIILQMEQDSDSS